MTEDAKPVKGKFRQALLRNVKDVKKARAESIASDGELVYRRKVEDIGHEIMRHVRKLEDRLDMSPDNVTTIINAKNFEAHDWVNEDLEIGRKIRNGLIDFKIAKARCEDLFGEMEPIPGMLDIAEIEALISGEGKGGL